MLRLRHISAALVLFGALLLAPEIASGQTDPTLWRFIHTNPKALISIDWRRLSHSNAGAILREKWIDANGASIPGIEFLDDVDRFVISSPGRDPADQTSEPPMLIVARGRFDTAKVRHALVAHGAKPQMFNAIQVYRPQGKGSKDMAFVVLDAQTILIGDARSVFQSLDQNRTPEVAASPLSARAAELDSNYDVWAIIQGSGAMAGNRLTELFSGGALGAEPQVLEAGVSVRNGLIADIHLLLPTEESAKSMVSELSQIIKTVSKDKASDPSILEMVKKLKVSSDGAIAKINLHLTPQELEKSARAFAASHKPPAAAAVADIRPVLPASPTPKQEKSVIRIEGLDEGIREIPYKPRDP
ncbi:MAG TPA: hypothetical protein VGV35_12890 [Bryobacteraceae bacterium]|nr:hypothetical protein [Bryobacteraceae bacterium]